MEVITWCPSLVTVLWSRATCRLMCTRGACVWTTVTASQEVNLSLTFSSSRLRQSWSAGVAPPLWRESRSHLDPDCASSRPCSLQRTQAMHRPLACKARWSDWGGWAHTCPNRASRLRDDFCTTGRGERERELSIAVKGEGSQSGVNANSRASQQQLWSCTRAAHGVNARVVSQAQCCVAVPTSTPTRARENWTRQNSHVLFLKQKVLLFKKTPLSYAVHLDQKHAEVQY